MPVEADDAVWGEAQAPTTLVAFLDFECPFCARGFQTLKLLQQEYGPERLRIVVKHLPLEFHLSALPAAVAAQAVRDASGNEAFFTYAERLLANQQALDASSLASLAEDVGVERSIYNEHVADEGTLQAVVHDLELARRLGVTGTPTFFVNGIRLEGAQPIDSFRELIDAESAAMAERLEAGAEWAPVYAERVRRNIHQGLGQLLLARDPTIYRAEIDGSPVWGDPSAPVTMVEFSDFECPFCKRARETVAALKQKYGNKLRVVFKHLPLPFHTQAKPAAQLADAVYRERGNAAFWQTVDRLFAVSPDLSEDQLIRIGVEAGLTEAEARAALDGAPSAQMERDANLAADLEATGTPHFFINGRRITGAQPLPHFEVFIDAALADAEKLTAAGVAPTAVYEQLMQSAARPGVPQGLDDEAATLLASARRPSRGPADAPVVIHVFSDFQCPFCKKAEEVVAALEDKYTDRIRIVWHHLPLPFHADARLAAHAAEEAFAQGGNASFWKMHAALFNLTGEAVDLSRPALETYAQRTGLDLERFRKALDARSHEEAIVTDEELADRLSIRATPTFLVGTYLVRGAQPLTSFERVVDRVLEEAQAR